jgi:isopentenyl diphosphate isomerase/L-lactate dehydrogenase-like FMN-dependent dehydrogenase
LKYTQVLGNRENDGGVSKEGDVEVGDKPPSFIDADTTWTDIQWIKRCHPNIKLFLKGVGSVEDVVRAHAKGVDGVVLSNHGVRLQTPALSSLTLVSGSPA